MFRSCWLAGVLVLAACSGGGERASSGSGGASNASSASGATGGSGSAGAGAGASEGSGGGSGSGGTQCLSSNGGGPGVGGGESGGGDLVCHGPGARYITRVVEACFGPGAGFGQDDFPKIVYGPPKGGGANQGSLDVLTLGVGGSIVVAFAGNAIVDGPGPDFIVFENPFDIGGDPNDPYAEPGTVAVSDDGVSWTSFPCTAKHFPYGECAGWHPVFANPDDNDIDPLDPAKAGGDAFDLADIGVARARFVRITSRPDLPTTFDLDAVAIVNAACP